MTVIITKHFKNWKKEVQRSWRSLLIHRLRTFLSTLGVLFGVVAVVAMLSIGEGAKQETLEQIEQLGMNSIIIRQSILADDQHKQALENRSYGLTNSDAEALEKGTPKIASQAPIKVIEASLTGTLKEMSPEILAVTRAYGEIKELKLAEGRFICDQDVHNRQLVCVLGYDVAKGLGKDGHVGQMLRIENVQYQVVGVIKATHWKASKNSLLNTRNMDKTILLPLGTEKSLPKSSYKLQYDVLSEIILQMNPSHSPSTTIKVIRNILEHSHHGIEDYQIIVPQELLNQALRTQHTFNLVLGSIAAISLLVGGIGIMNIMLATVSERTREIGVRRAVGANKQHIITQFLFETLLLTFIGATLGILIGILFSMLISYVAGWKTIVTLWSLILSLGMATVVGLCSGIYPAIKAANMNPITALRHE